MTFREATNLLAVPLDEVAKVTGRSYNAVLAYRNGARKPPPEVLGKLAAFMRKHSTELAAAADELGKHSMSDDGSTDSVGAGRRPKVVFFVDDDDEFRHTTSDLLKSRGYEMLLAASAEEASDVIETFDGEIDVLLMDINLPDGWGATVAYRLRQARPNMALVFITGFAESDPVLSGGLHDAEFVVTKPVTTDRLVYELERAINPGS